MSVAILIPARYASSRYPGKPLAPLRGAGGRAKPLVRRSLEAGRAVPGIDRVAVVTDDERITAAAGGTALMTPETCRNGTERCAAALSALPEDIDIVVNLQGDAPLTPPGFVTALVAALAGDPAAEVATPVLRANPATRRRLLADQAAGRVGGTTVVGDAEGRALYFSKAVIPHIPEGRMDEAALPLFLHVGVYAYRRAALARYAALPPSPLEELEGLEQLRFLAHGVAVRLVEVPQPAHEIWELNNPEDVAPIEAALVAAGIA